MIQHSVGTVVFKLRVMNSPRTVDRGSIGFGCMLEGADAIIAMFSADSSQSLLLAERSRYVRSARLPQG